MTVAVTVTTLGEAADEAGGGAVAEETTAEELGEAVLPIAAAWKAANWSPGLMANTIPC